MLAPLLVEEILHILERLRDEENATTLLVEQNANLALSIADEGLCHGERQDRSTGRNTGA